MKCQSKSMLNDYEAIGRAMLGETVTVVCPDEESSKRYMKKMEQILGDITDE